MTMKDFRNVLLFSFIVIAYAHSQISYPNMVLVEGGSFLMGCNAAKEGTCNTGETPRHWLNLKDFLICEHEVTEAEFNKFESLPYSSCGSDCPKVDVTWYAAIVYCNFLSANLGLTPCYYNESSYTSQYGRSGNVWTVPSTTNVFWKKDANGFRLPSEAEWEYAARGGIYNQNYIYSGSDQLSDVGYFASNSGSTKKKVKQLPSNELNIYDMSGNVAEWCWDAYSSTTYQTRGNAICAPSLDDTNSTTRISRGGHFGSSENFCKNKNRGSSQPSTKQNNYGFRIAKNR